MAKVQFGKWTYEEDELARQYAAATPRGREAIHHEPQARSVQYEPEGHQLRILLKNGVTCLIPCVLIEELDGAPPEAIAGVELGPRGAALHWERLDVDVSLAGLLARLLGSRVTRTKRPPSRQTTLSQGPSAIPGPPGESHAT
ncbi:MAG: DUF2442 domain-containing protein [Candidatus Tectimicrobiota bacterium]